MGSDTKRRKVGPKDEDRELEEMEETIKRAIECSSTLRQRLTGDRVGPALTS